MSKSISCDKCEKDITHDTFIFNVRIESASGVRLAGEAANTDHDLCDKCRYRLRQWFGEKPVADA